MGNNSSLITHHSSFPTNEKRLSQIPALQVLLKLGYEYLSPEEALKERLSKRSNVLLENTLRNQLKRINQINYKGSEYLFSEENIQSAIQKLKNIKFDGLQKTNEAVYDLITLGTAMEQSIEGDSKSFNLHYIDWKNPANNVFHVVPEFSVERTRSTETARPDLVLFVNGIPLAVIECKAPDIEIDQAISQSIRNQSDDFIPKLFVYAQLVMGVSKNEAQYATVGTGKKFWGIWKEEPAVDGCQLEVDGITNKTLTAENKDRLFSGEFAVARTFFQRLEDEGDRLVTEQDKALHALCRPERLLELVFKFIVVDGGIKKIARYQQFFVIKSTLERIKQQDSEGQRKGGIIWHTQGSGKSLTMVMLARNLALDPDISNPRIVLVTDREDLDRQLGNTFAACGLNPERATSGRHLLELVATHKAGIVTTLIHKFDKAMKVRSFKDDSSDIFVLVDESHRTQFGSFSARMRQMFPKACYIGFTGTPLMKEEKNNFIKFGGLIEPHYSIGQAVEDGAVVPLLYEGRLVEMEQNKAAIDLWFERHTKGLTKEQQADLKKKYARAEMLNKTEQVVYMRAYDISEHYRKAWQGTGFKAQLVAPSKAAALMYRDFLNELDTVSCEVIISGPDTRDGYEETDEEPSDEVLRFWNKMMARYGSEEDYNKQVINQFKFGEDPEILIVVSKLLTGFDAPCNTVIYLCKELREHTLLQAIARVNRVHENKDYGYVVDYVGLLGELDKALSMYDAFEGFDENDLAGSLTSIQSQIDQLPQRYSDLWDLFKAVKNSYDEDAYEQLLADEDLRDEFYSRLTEYSKTLAVALSSERFVTEITDLKLEQYKADLKRFHKLKVSVKMRYAESIDYRDYEPKIKKLLDTHIQANEAIQLNEPVNIFDDTLFGAVKEEMGVYTVKKTDGAKADAIAHATKKVITESMEEDPAFYSKFSKLIQDAIDDFRAKVISAQEYLEQVTDIRHRVVTKQHDDIPTSISSNEEAMAYFGVIKPLFGEENEMLSADAALAIARILESHISLVHFWDDSDAQNLAINEIEDYLFDEVRDKTDIDLTLDQMDELIESTMRIARNRSGK
ncbi:Type-1 restriction enzyme R protein [Pontiella desulfatans]|uniref:Type I restriction enzyme endonuclease subunit n=1 Tax=Pontiella desulfatans TaxID=2750659 RepID=A0A6C2TZW1_PONDE|nr:type I restriction endonuclease subunit R [Pontiella desulfatans]VGO12706.1 Type-1 restriction enzyme R protein [Pontiella desulfatans]